MNAFKCDRCGKYYEHYTMKYEPREFVCYYNNIIFLGKRSVGCDGNITTSFDLCPECMEYFMNWITPDWMNEQKGGEPNE